MQVWTLGYYENGWLHGMVGVYSSLENALEAMENDREENEYGPIEDLEKGTYKHKYYLKSGIYEIEMFNLDY